MGFKDKLNTINKLRNDILKKIREVNEDTPSRLRLDKFVDYIIPCENEGGDKTPSPSSLYFKMEYLAGTFMIPVKNFTGTIDWGDGTEIETHTNADDITHTYDEFYQFEDFYIVLEGSADKIDTNVGIMEDNYQMVYDFASTVVAINFGDFKIKSMEGFMSNMSSDLFEGIIGLPNTESYENMYKGGSIIHLFNDLIFQKGMYAGASFREHLKLSENVDIINDRLFNKTNFRKGFEFQESVRYIGESAFEGASFKMFDYNEDVDLFIPANTYIGANAFKDIKKYDLVYFGEGCTIGDEAFNGIKIQALQIPNDTKLGKGVFTRGEFDMLLSYGNLTEIPERTFERASFAKGEAMLLIPKTIKKIGSKAFAYAKFKQIKVPKSVEVADDAFEGISKDKIIYED